MTLRDGINEMGENTINLAYKITAVALMLQISNVVLRGLGFTGDSITYADIGPTSHIWPVCVPGTNGLVITNFTGSLVSTDFFFGFFCGQPANFWKWEFHPNSQGEIMKHNSKLAGIASLLDTNSARQVALAQLKAIGIDTERLERNCSLQVTQRHYNPGPRTNVVLLPVFKLDWHGPVGTSEHRTGRLVASAVVFGGSRQIVEYHIIDASLFSRPPLTIPNTGQLLAVPDSDFVRTNILPINSPFHSALPLLQSVEIHPSTNFVKPLDSPTVNEWRRP